MLTRTFNGPVAAAALLSAEQVHGMITAVGLDRPAAAWPEPEAPGRWRLADVAAWIGDELAAPGRAGDGRRTRHPWTVLGIDAPPRARRGAAGDPTRPNPRHPLDQVVAAGARCTDAGADPRDRLHLLAELAELPLDRLPDVLELLAGVAIEPGSPVDVWLLRAARASTEHADLIVAAFRDGRVALSGDVLAAAGAAAVPAALDALAGDDRDRRRQAAVALRQLAAAGHELNQAELARVFDVALDAMQ